MNTYSVGNPSRIFLDRINNALWFRANGNGITKVSTTSGTVIGTYLNTTTFNTNEISQDTSNNIIYATTNGIFVERINGSNGDSISSPAIGDSNNASAVFDNVNNFLWLFNSSFKELQAYSYGSLTSPNSISFYQNVDFNMGNITFDPIGNRVIATYRDGATGATKTNILILNATTGAIIDTITKNEIETIGKVIVDNTNNCLWTIRNITSLRKVDLATRVITDYSLTFSIEYGANLVFDNINNNLWVTSQNGSVVKISTSNPTGKTEYPLPSGYTGDHLAINTVDRCLWIACYSDSKIIKMKI